jgi:hypothetical protein
MTRSDARRIGIIVFGAISRKTPRFAVVHEKGEPNLTPNSPYPRCCCLRKI